MKTSKRKSKPRATGGDRTVVLTNGEEYVTNLQEQHAIVGFGPKSRAKKYFLRNVPDVLRNVNRIGHHKLWAEEIDE